VGRNHLCCFVRASPPILRDNSGEVSHAGIVVGKNLYNPEAPRDTLVVLSKWGDEGEYEHDATDVPLVGAAVAVVGPPSVRPGPNAWRKPPLLTKGLTRAPRSV
jgi:hypothetical protein